MSVPLANEGEQLPKFVTPQQFIEAIAPELRDKHEEEFDTRTGEFYCGHDEETWPCRVIAYLDEHFPDPEVSRG